MIFSLSAFAVIPARFCSSQDATGYPSVSRGTFAQNLFIPARHATRWHEFDPFQRDTRCKSADSICNRAPRDASATSRDTFAQNPFVQTRHATRWHEFD